MTYYPRHFRVFAERYHNSQHGQDRLLDFDVFVVTVWMNSADPVSQNNALELLDATLEVLPVVPILELVYFFCMLSRETYQERQTKSSKLYFYQYSRL